MLMSHLFDGGDLRSYLDERLRAMLEAIARASAESLDAASAVDSYAESARVTPLALNRQGISRSEIHETKLDARRLHDAASRGVEGHREPVWIPGRFVDFRVPYSGDRMLWSRSPNLIGPPHPYAKVSDEFLTIRIQGPADATSTEQIKEQLSGELARFDPWLNAANRQVEDHNSRLVPEASAAMDRRRDELQELASIEEELDIPIAESRPANPTSRDW